MSLEQDNHEMTPVVPAPVERLLNGLWQQREELGVIAG